MKKTTLNLMLALTCVAALTALALAAVPTTLMTAKIPFTFHVGNKAFPAGTYTVIRASSPGIVMLRNEDQPNQNAGTIAQITSSRTANEKATLQFRRYGDQYFLASVTPAGTGTNFELPKARSERAAAEGAKNLAGTSVKPEIVTVLGQ
ncbi:MAG: hypothetical protein HOP19_24095 [Acidobacteria bacterium]|nr:hypothetical protein [Acidobacteriota bacterium]